MKNIGDYFGEITGNKTSLIAFKNLSNSGAKISAEKELILIAKNITNESTTRGIVHNNSKTVTTDTALIDVKNIKLESGIDYKNREKQIQIKNRREGYKWKKIHLFF